MDDEVVLRRYSLPHEAHLARLYLEQHAIQSRIDDAMVVGLDPSMGLAMGGIKLRVRQPDAARADELLRELEQSDSPADVREDELSSDGGDGVADASSARASAADQLAKRACHAAWFSWFLCPGVGHLYSVWLIARITPHHLSAAGRRQYREALILDAIVLAVAVWALVAF
jgi:hypothetical protein